MTRISDLVLPKHIAQPNPNIYLGDNYVVLDFETTNVDRGSALSRSNRLVLSSWVENRKRGREATLYKWGGEYDQGELVTAVQSSDFIVAHNAKFELGWLARCGVDTTKLLVWDTLLAEYVLAGNRRKPLSLGETARRRGLRGKGSLVSSLIGGGVCPSDIPEQWLVEYGCRDTELCHAIFLQQRDELNAAGLLPTMYTRCLLTPVLADIESRGMQLDPVRVKEEYEKYSEEHRRASDELGRITGGINLNSPKQVGEYLYGTLGFDELTGRGGVPDRTDAGGRRTDSDALTLLNARTEKQWEFKAVYEKFRPLDTQLRALEKMRLCCQDESGLLYGVLNQAVTQTHRLSSSGKKYKLQFQNFYRGFKKLFKAREPGWLVGEADGAQLEFRVAAHLGRDPVASADIRDPGFDAHYQTAETLLKRTRDKISKAERADAKPRTFKPLYGGMSGTKDEVRYYKFFQQRYKAIYDTQTRWTFDVLAHKALKTETGLIFYWPDTKLDGNYITNKTSIFNYPVQSLATAEIIPIALVYFWHRAKVLGLKLFLTNTIHDSIIAELPPEEEEIFRELSEYCFTTDCFSYLSRVYGIQFTVPLGAETKVGAHWSEGTERKFDLDPMQLQPGTASLPLLAANDDQAFAPSKSARQA